MHQQRRAGSRRTYSMPANTFLPRSLQWKFETEACIKPKNVLIILEPWREWRGVYNDAFNPCCNVWKHYINQEKMLQTQLHCRYQSWRVQRFAGTWVRRAESFALNPTINHAGLGAAGAPSALSPALQSTWEGRTTEAARKPTAYCITALKMPTWGL